MGAKLQTLIINCFTERFDNGIVGIFLETLLIDFKNMEIYPQNEVLLDYPDALQESDFFKMLMQSNVSWSSLEDIKGLVLASEYLDDSEGPRLRHVSVIRKTSI